MKKILCGAGIALAVALAGCATIYEPYELRGEPGSGSPEEGAAVRSFISVSQLKKGLSRKDVKTILGNQVVIGYEMPDVTQERYRPVVVDNPYRVEERIKGSRAYVIDYYLTGINASDGTVSDDELTPLLFLDDRLVAWGWDALKTF